MLEQLTLAVAVGIAAHMFEFTHCTPHSSEVSSSAHAMMLVWESPLDACARLTFGSL